MNEADTCTKYVVPQLVSAGWNAAPHSFTVQRTFTENCVYVHPDAKTRCVEKNRVGFLLHYTRACANAAVEAKSKYKHAGEGLSQAKGYAKALAAEYRYEACNPLLTMHACIYAPRVGVDTHVL